MSLRLVYATSYVLTLAVLNELDYYALSVVVMLHVACLFSCSSNIIKAFLQLELIRNTLTQDGFLVV